MHDVRSKFPPWGYTTQSNSRGLPDPPPPPPLGLDTDRCITEKRTLKASFFFRKQRAQKGSESLAKVYFALTAVVSSANQII